jgi:hypothetical protein
MPADPAASLDQARQIDALCDRFEQDWLAHRRPAIEAYLTRVPEEGDRPCCVSC